jgi:voltage-gated potassium channel
MTTLGSGIDPHTDAGRILRIAVVLIGISFVALLTGAIAERFIKPRFQEVEEEVALEEEQLLREIREISTRLQRVERALARRARYPRSQPPLR